MQKDISAREFFVIDRFEGTFVTLQSLTDGETFVVSRDMFFDKPVEGDVIYIENGQFNVDADKTQERKERLNVRVKGLFGRKKREKA
jgi:pyruvate kinase